MAGRPRTDRSNVASSHTLTLTPDTLAALRARGRYLSAVTRRIVARYELMTAFANETIAVTFTHDELEKIYREIGRRSYDDVRLIGLLEDDLRRLGGETWNKVVRLSPSERIAMVDAAEAAARKERKS